MLFKFCAKLPFWSLTFPKIEFKASTRIGVLLQELLPKKLKRTIWKAMWDSLIVIPMYTMCWGKADQSSTGGRSIKKKKTQTGEDRVPGCLWDERGSNYMVETKVQT